MSKKEIGNKDGNDLDIDLDAFEKQVDLEVDRLFGAAGNAPLWGGAVPDSAPVVEGIPEIPAKKEPEIPVEKKPEILAKREPEIPVEKKPQVFDEKKEEDLVDLNAFEHEIDLEIDKLFGTSPGPAPWREASPEAGTSKESFRVMSELKAAPVDVPSAVPSMEIEKAGPDKYGDIGMEYPRATETVEPVKRSKTGDTVAPPEIGSLQLADSAPTEAPISQPPVNRAASREAMAKLIEALNVAYLSLDWDFTVENITGLDVAIMNLEPHCRDMHEADSIMKVLRTVLRRMKMQSNSLSPPLMQFISDAYEFFVSLLQRDTAPGAQEKQQLNSLMERLRALKPKSAETEEGGSVEFGAGADRIDSPLPEIRPEPLIPERADVVVEHGQHDGPDTSATFDPLDLAGPPASSGREQPERPYPSASPNEQVESPDFSRQAESLKPERREEQIKFSLKLEQADLEIDRLSSAGAVSSGISVQPSEAPPPEKSPKTAIEVEPTMILSDTDMADIGEPPPETDFVESPSMGEAARAAQLDNLAQPLEPIVFTAPAELRPPVGAQSFQRMEPVLPTEPSEPKRTSESNDLPWLLESLDVACVSLDWDFSPENVQALDHTIMSIEPFARHNHHATSIVKVLRSVLQRLRMQPESVSPMLLHFISDALDFFKTQIHQQTDNVQQDSAQLQGLISRLRTLRSGEKAQEAVEEAVQPAKQPLVPAPEQTDFRRIDPKGLEGMAVEPFQELRRWMEGCHEQSTKAALRFEKEVNRLQHLEEALNKKPQLQAVASRLSRTRTALSEYIAVCHEKEPEWTNRIRQILDLEQNLGKAPVLQTEPTITPITPAPPLQAVQDLELISDLPDVSFTFPFAQSEPVREVLGTRQEQVCLFVFSGRRIALPASNVVKFEKLSGRKAKKLLDCGYATLSDFKPFFKSLKRGLMGKWSTLSTGELKTYRFPAMPQRDLLLADDPSWEGEPATLDAVEGVVLVSNGQSHGMIFTDSAEMDLRIETVKMHPGDGLRLGVIGSDSESSIGVLNVENLLKKREQQSEK